jgi:hypothetical protein
LAAAFFAGAAFLAFGAGAACAAAGAGVSAGFFVAITILPMNKVRHQTMAVCFLHFSPYLFFMQYLSHIFVPVVSFNVHFW